MYGAAYPCGCISTNGVLHTLCDNKNCDRMNSERQQVINLIQQGLMTDGAHHKQWYLEEILKRMNVRNAEIPDHEDGIAP